ncbi:MAG: YigZ family protein [Paludibacteraceae bacterium]|nr:YigZ family protein [Paludibacteraceae bacterium]
MADQYLTIKQLSEGLYKDKGSKFLSFAIPVEDIEQVKLQLAYYKKQYFDARHVCYAYMLGPDHDQFRANDDGEPSGTAGKPILGQINSHNLTNILVVVVRYFGGILLGTGGLIVAYKQAAQDAINNAQIISRAVEIHKEITFPYHQINQIMRILKDIEARIVKQDYKDNNCIIEFYIKKQYEGRI